MCGSRVHRQLTAVMPSAVAEFSQRPLAVSRNSFFINSTKEDEILNMLKKLKRKGLVELMEFQFMEFPLYVIFVF